jgi:hypothetical protein
MNWPDPTNRWSGQLSYCLEIAESSTLHGNPSQARSQLKRAYWIGSLSLSLMLAPLFSGCVVRPQPYAPVVYVPPPQPQPVYVQPAPPPPVYEAAPAPVAEATLYPTTPPPDPIPEYQPPAPGYGYYWAPGYWDWTGYEWNWNSGYWTPQRSGYLFIGPRFVWEDGRPVYYRSYWQGPNGYRDYAYGGGRGPAGWRARPQYEPRTWRSEPAHSSAWRNAPGAPAGGWRGEPPGVRREERREAEHREERREVEHREEHREAEHREAEHRGEMERGPGPGMHSGPEASQPRGGPPGGQPGGHPMGPPGGPPGGQPGGHPMGPPGGAPRPNQMSAAPHAAPPPSHAAPAPAPRRKK